MHFSTFVRQLAAWRAGDKKLVRDVVKAFQFAEFGARQVLNSSRGGDYRVEGHEFTRDQEARGRRLDQYLERRNRALYGDDDESEAW